MNMMAYYLLPFSRYCSTSKRYCSTSQSTRLFTILYGCIVECIVSVYCFSVLFQCIVSVYCFSVLFQCIVSVYCFSVLFQCIVSVYCFSVQIMGESKEQLLFLFFILFSKRIKQLGFERDKEPNPHLQKLQRSIRQYASQYLTENMFILPVLPSPDKYAKLLKEKELNRGRIKAEKTERVSSTHSSMHSPSIPIKREHNMKINKSMERSKNKSEASKTSPDTVHSSRPTSSTFKPSSKELRPIQAISISRTRDSSWGPVQVSSADMSSSAVTQQIENVKGYLAQARQAGKKDEIKLFEDNLRELLVFDMQQKGADS